MKTLSLTLMVLIAAMGHAWSDPNIYGPHGENLGPNPDIEQVFPEIRQKRELEELKDKNRQLEEKVQNLEQQEQQAKQYARSQPYTNPPVQININSRTNSDYNSGFWPFFGGGVVRSHGRGGVHHGGGGQDHHR